MAKDDYGFALNGSTLGESFKALPTPRRNTIWRKLSRPCMAPPRQAKPPPQKANALQAAR
ncbi:MAG: hypothetical protein ACTXOO_00565 [Sodalis sp. (in: enterobacteria)]